ncbi:MAG TPA: prepilin peptidase [Rhizomicrobium sp.]|nr:prepilin peptidase [Rhizomicrobium sp.]
MIAPWLALIPLIVLLLLAAGWDLASFTIPNFIQIGLILAFAAFFLTAGIPLSALGGHLLAGLLGLAFGFTLFALGYIGGGDAKLLACVSLWLGFTDLPAYVLLACVLGGALSLAILALRKLPLPSFFARQPWLLRLHDPKEGVPYGVALAAAVFLILPQTEVFRLVASQV